MGAALKKRAAKWDLLVAAVIILAALVLAVGLFPHREQGLSVRVVMDGQVLLQQDLSKLDTPVLFQVEGEYPLTLELTSTGVRVIETSCPGEDCMHMGTVSDAGRQIICLPNHLIVTLQGDAPDYDAVVG